MYLFAGGCFTATSVARLRYFILLFCVLGVVLSASQGQAMLITVQNTLDATTTVEVESSDSIENLSNKIETTWGVPVAHQKLTYNGVVMESGKTLANYNVVENSLVRLFFNLGSAGVLYVNDDTTATVQDGVSWDYAFQSLEDALMTARTQNAGTTDTVKQIWVTRGDYFPSRALAVKDVNNVPTTARDRAFLLVDGVDMIGGFTGTESEPSQRPFPFEATVLDGNIGNTPQEAAYHVVVGMVHSEPLLLDGFVIENGYSHSSQDQGFLTINGYFLPRGMGAGLYARQCTFEFQTVGFVNNTARAGGALGLGDCNIIGTDVFFVGNRADEGGSVIAELGKLSLTNCLFAGNSAPNGSAVSSQDTLSVMTNVTVVHNHVASVSEGAAAREQADAKSVRNMGRSAPAPGYTFVYSSDALSFRNTLMVDNDGSDLATSAALSYTYVDGVYHTPSGYLATTLTAADVFATPGSPANPLSGDYSLKPGTLAVNGGDNAVFQPGMTPDLSHITTDITGAQRIQGYSVDLGAFESMASNVAVWDLY